VGRRSIGSCGARRTSEGARDVCSSARSPSSHRHLLLDNNRSSKSDSGAAAAAWAGYMRVIAKGSPVRQFPPNPVLTAASRPTNPPEEASRPNRQPPPPRAGPGRGADRPSRRQLVARGLPSRGTIRHPLGLPRAAHPNPSPGQPPQRAQTGSPTDRPPQPVASCSGAKLLLPGRRSQCSAQRPSPAATTANSTTPCGTNAPPPHLGANALSLQPGAWSTRVEASPPRRGPELKFERCSSWVPPGRP